MSRFLTFCDFVEPAACSHLGRTVVRGVQDSPHSHDFAEIFWIESGRGIHRINGQDQPVSTGTIVLIRPTDVHAFASQPDEPLTLLNLAFTEETIPFLAERYGREVSFFGDLSAAMPPVSRVMPADLERLRRAAEGLLACRESRLELERVLLLIGHLVSRRGEHAQPPLPVWLEQALERVRQPEHFRQGPEHLAELAQRSHEHLARVLKQKLGVTPSALLNRIRCDHAARQLIRTDDAILDIAFDCGYGSVSHFYACFRDRHGVPPRQYRQAHRALL